jgi:MFS family permease
VGAAGASPAAFSLLSDYYPAARRATALAFYSGGIYLGAGLGLMIGGQIVGRWDDAFPDASAPFGLRGWQVAFFVVGLPGLLLALWVSTLREPVRGALDGLVAEAEPHPFRAAARELMAVLPPLTLWNLVRSGAGARGVVWNLVAATLLALAAMGLVAATGDTAQWVAMAIGLYATVSWVQSLGLRDRQAAALILGTPTLRWTALGVGWLAFTGYGVGYWTTPFFLREHGIPVERAGLLLGGTAAAAGWLGVTLGGVLADAWRRRTPNGRLYLVILGAVLPVPILPWLLLTESTTTALLLNVPLSMAGSMWIGSGASTVQELVLPRMRATASAAYLLVITFIGLALGPYTIGQLSDAIGLRGALLAGLGANALALVCLVPAVRNLVRDERTLLERAQKAA